MVGQANAYHGLYDKAFLRWLLHCDLVLAATDARFRFPFVDLGLAPEAGSSATLPLALGKQEAFYLFSTCTWVDCDRAVEIGLVWRAVPSTHLLQATLDIAHQIAAKPLASLVATKKL